MEKRPTALLGVLVSRGLNWFACQIPDPGVLCNQQDELSLNGDEDSYRKGQPHAEVQMAFRKAPPNHRAEDSFTTQQDQN